jgi:hypothetical protein
MSMTVALQLASAAALRELRLDTLAFLRATPFTVAGIPGTDTAVMQLAFGCGNGMAAMGPVGAIMPLVGMGAVNNGVNVVATPMRRSTGLALATRTNATARIAAPQPDLWVTVRQTGCSVLILDWGAGSYSMAHLQPFGPGAYNSALRTLLTSWDPLFYGTQRLSLQAELHQVANNTRGAGPPPARYIMVQSTWTNAGGHFLGVTGVRRAAAWTFFLQEYDANGVHSARQLDWQPWNHWGLYRTPTY